MSDVPVRFEIGSPDEVILGRAASDGVTRIRQIDPAEEKRVDSAVAVVRRYVSRNPTLLLLSAHELFAGEVAALGEPSVGSVLPWHANRVMASLVSWLLLWRLTLDQWRHDVSSRFGKNSDEYRQLTDALSRAYDQHAGYRVSEGMRNLVQHREMPPLHVTHEQTRDAAGQRQLAVHVTVPPRWFLDWQDCPRILRTDMEQLGEADVEVPAAVADAMAGIGTVLAVLAQIDGPELLEAVSVLGKLTKEAGDGSPVIMRSEGELRGGMNLRMTRLDDLVPLIRILTGTTTQS